MVVLLLILWFIQFFIVSGAVAKGLIEPPWLQAVVCNSEKLKNKLLIA